MYIPCSIPCKYLEILNFSVVMLGTTWKALKARTVLEGPGGSNYQKTGRWSKTSRYMWCLRQSLMHHPSIPKVAQNNSLITVVNAETGAVGRKLALWGSKLIHLRTAIEHDGGLLLYPMRCTIYKLHLLSIGPFMANHIGYIYNRCHLTQLPMRGP